MTRWAPVLAAVFLGLLLTPAVVILSIQSTLSITAMVVSALIVGALAGRSGGIVRGAAGGLLVVVGAFSLFGVVVARSLTAPFAMAAFAWWWLVLSALAGASGAALARARRGTSFGVFGAALLVFVAGWVVAFAVASDSLISGDPCQTSHGMSAECNLYINCIETAERRRFGTLERVTLFDLSSRRARCEYVAWGGIRVGAVEVDGGGSHWDGGP